MNPYGGGAASPAIICFDRIDRPWKEEVPAVKRCLCVLLSLALMLVAPALAEGELDAVAGTYELSSGVGDWFTQLTVAADGSFSGYYQDTDMDGGELAGAAYESTVHCSRFTGTLVNVDRFGVWELDCKIGTLTWDEGPSYVRDGELRVPTRPSGLNEGDSLRFFAEGAALATLPEGFLVWARLREGDIRWQNLPYDAMYNETADALFSGVAPGEERWTPEPGDDTPTSWVDWSIFTGEAFQTEAPRAETTAEPEDDPAFAGISYPVRAEVVNCATGVSLRAEPSTRANLLAEVPLGAVVEVQSNKGWLGNDRWFLEVTYQGQRGYICIDYLDVLLPDEVRFTRAHLKGASGTVCAVNRGTDLIMRSGPGTGYDSRGFLFGGEVLAYLGDAKQDAQGTCWYHCSHYGDECWISARYTVLTTNDGQSYTGSRGIY